ncbi:MAG: aminopeptidase [Thaumarchaeota archaeon]|nr:aminopeptidase [Nitrososphaerota archaeon]
MTKSSNALRTIAKTSLKLVRDLLKTREGETVAITCDTESDWAFVSSVEEAAISIGAKPLVIRTKAPPYVGRAAEPFLPIDSLVGAVAESDVWIELNGKWLLYSKVWEEAMKRNRTRYMCLVGMNIDMANSCVGNVDVAKVLEFQRRIQKITERSRSMHYTTPGGTDVRFENDTKRPVLVEGDVSGPGEYMLLGQVDWAPLEETINGTIAFDGSVNPPDELGLLKKPIKLEVRNGRVVRVHGGREATIYEKWLKSLNDENMYELAHLSYGCNPGAKLTGNVLEDERIWGVLEWGLGNQSGTFRARDIRAISHSDGITLKPTLEGDGQLIIKDGKFVHPDLLGFSMSMK